MCQNSSEMLRILGGLFALGSTIFDTNTTFEANYKRYDYGFFFFSNLKTIVGCKHVGQVKGVFSLLQISDSLSGMSEQKKFGFFFCHCAES